MGRRRVVSIVILIAALLLIHGCDDLDMRDTIFYLSGTGPIIKVSVGQVDIASEGAVYDFGSVPIGSQADASVTITISNSGAGELHLGAGVAVTGPGVNDFTVTSPTSRVLPGVDAGGDPSTVTFTVAFAPQSSGAKEITISIPNNDAAADPFVFIVIGAGIDQEVETPEIEVWQSTAEIQSGGSFSFGNVAVNASDTVVFTIKNTGTGDLVLDGTPLVDIYASAEFSVGSYPSLSTITGPSGTTTFTLVYSPSATGDHSTSVSIENNDVNEDPFIFTISGAGVNAPEIEVWQSTTELSSGGSFPFGDVAIGDPQAIQFTVKNVGSSDLLLSGASAVELSGTGDFSVTTQPSSTTIFWPSGTRTFSITFDPSTTGNHTKTVSIVNNDPDENPFTFTISGNGVVVAPEIEVWRSTAEISSGGSFDFGYVDVGSPATLQFTIKNVGTADLILDGAPLVAIPAGEFSVASQPSSTTIFWPSGTTVFSITFDPGGAGAFSESVTIENNDADLDPFTFTVTGDGVSGGGA